MKKEPDKCGTGPLMIPSDRDWTEDFEHENGNYFNTCFECKQTFKGHKRRVLCKQCGTPNWLELSKRKRPDDTKHNQAWSGAWLEGEMVGYAKCMAERVLPNKSVSKDSQSEIESLREIINYERKLNAQYQEKSYKQEKQIKELESKFADQNELTKIYSFLFGVSELDGYWFGAEHPNGKFWWRSKLRNAIDGKLSPKEEEPTSESDSPQEQK